MERQKKIVGTVRTEFHESECFVVIVDEEYEEEDEKHIIHNIIITCPLHVSIFIYNQFLANFEMLQSLPFLMNMSITFLLNN